MFSLLLKELILDFLFSIKVFFRKKAKIMYKMYNNLAPTYLHEMLQMRDVNLDNTSNIRSVAHKKNIYCHKLKGSFSYSSVVVWNSIPVHIKTASSLEAFVKRCTEWIKKNNCLIAIRYGLVDF